MNTATLTEKWKRVKFDVEDITNGHLEISSYGRVRTYNRLSDGNIIKGSITEGYNIIRLKLYKPRSTHTQKQIDYLELQLKKALSEVTKLKHEKDTTGKIKELKKLTTTLKAELTQKRNEDLNARTTNWHSLVHRLVAQYFIKKPSAKHTIVAHLNYKKEDNHMNNLKWMTPAENVLHQKGSPAVIEAKSAFITHGAYKSNATKLTVTRVMLLKKLLLQGKPIKTLVKQFNITDTQIYRIQRGENWKNIAPAN